MPSPSSPLSRQWVAEAIAADDRLDFSLLKALVSGSPEFLADAPEAARERVALRCLQECAAAGGCGDGGCGNGEMAARVRIEASRSCEDVLFDLLGKVGSSGSLDKDKLLPFKDDIQEFILVKKSALPKTSLELLKEAVPESTFLASSSPMEHRGTSAHDEDQLLSNVNREHENVNELRSSSDGAQLDKETSTSLTKETETGNLGNDPSEPAQHVLQQSLADSKRSDNNRQEDIVADIGASIQLAEKNPINEEMSMQAVVAPASNGSNNIILHGNITETNHLLEHNLVKSTTMVHQQSYGGTSPPYPPHKSDGSIVHERCAGIQSSKNLTHEGLTMPTMGARAFGSSNAGLEENISGAKNLPEQIILEDSTMIQQHCSIEPHLNPHRQGTGDKVNQNPDDDSASIQPLENGSGREGFTAEITGALPAGSCNLDMQGDKSEANHLPEENIIEHTMMVERHTGNRACQNSSLVSSSIKVNQTLNDDGMLEKNPLHGVSNVQTGLASDSGNIALSEANHLTEHNIAKNLTVDQQTSASRSVPNSLRDNVGNGGKQTPKDKGLGTILQETSSEHYSDDISDNIAAANLLFVAEKSHLFSSQVQGTNHSIGSWTEQDLCIKCGKRGELLKCSSDGCMLAAHESCFGSLVMFDDSGQFYCPVCSYSRATAAYCKAKQAYSQARKNLAAFLGNSQAVEHRNEQSTGVQPRAANNEGHHLNESNSGKRQDNHQVEGVNLSNQGKEPDRQVKKKKKNAGSCDASILGQKTIERTADGAASFVENSEVMQINKEPALQKNSEQVRSAEKEQPAENTEAQEKPNYGNSTRETRRSSHRRRDTSAVQQEVEANEEDGVTKSQQSNGSEDIETASSNDSGKRSSPPWHNTRNCKTRFQERDAAGPYNPEEASGHHRHISSPSKKRKYAYPTKRYSNSLAPAGRRAKLPWTEEEEAALTEAMQQLAPQDNLPIPWRQILERGRSVFHRTRLPADLRVKWRYLKKKEGL